VDIAKETPVTVRVEKQPFSKVLDLTLDSIAPKGRPLAWRLTDSTIAVSTQMRILLASRAARVQPAAATPAGDRRESAGRPRQIDFDNTPLHLALGFLKDMADVNMHVNWRALEMTGISKDTPITVKVTDVSIARAMDLVLNQLNAGRDKLSSIYWVIDAGVVEVSTGESLNTDTRVRVFDIGDLLVVAPNFRGPRISLDSSDNNTSGSNGTSGGASLFADYNSSGNNGAGGGSEEGESITVQRERIKDTLIQTIKDSIGEDMWSPIGKGSISVMRNKLLISQTTLGFKLLEQVIGPG
jgi:hypothetical protein